MLSFHLSKMLSSALAALLSDAVKIQAAEPEEDMLSNITATCTTGWAKCKAYSGLTQASTADAICMGASRLIVVLSFLFPPTAFGQVGCASEFLNPQESYPHNTALPAAAPLELKPGMRLGAVHYKVAGDPVVHTLDEYLDKFCTTGLLVIKDEQIVFERYLQGRKPTDHLLSASMSKTILALLIGIAIGDGKLTLSDRVSALLPELSASAFADATVEDILRMSSGAALTNSFERGVDSDNRAINPMIWPRRDVLGYLQKKTGRSSGPGSVFDYNGAETAVLGLIMKRRTGSSATAYLEEKVWRPMGAESAGYWIINQNGDEGVAGQFAATLRDYARLGILVMNQGHINGHQVIPADWITQMTQLRADKPQPSHPPFYGLHIWIPQAAGGRAMFWGVNGQNIFIDPVARVVIVHTGNGPYAEFNGNAHLFPCVTRSFVHF
jgi:CubicO group peptidase (beta-lactamase class C family)